MIEVYDNYFADDFLMDSYKYFCKIGWNLDNRANRYQYPDTSFFSEGSHLFFGKDLTPQLTDKVDYVRGPLDHWMNINRGTWNVYYAEANLQSLGMEGTWHTDETEYTLLYFPHYKWDKSWGGEFQTKIEENIETYEIKPGRMILIRGDITHRALAPRVPNVYRMSIAYRLEKEYEARN